MVRFLRLIGRWAANAPLLIHLARRLLPNPFDFVSGKPLERWLLNYDLGDRTLALGNDPNTVATVMLDREGAFPKSGALQALLGPLIGRGVFGQPGGPGVKAARRLFIHALARIPEQQVVDVCRRDTESYLERWLVDGSRAAIPICHELSRLTVDIVSQCTLWGRFSASESEHFTRLFFKYHQQCLPLLMIFSDDASVTREKLVRRMGLDATGSEIRQLVAARFLAPLIVGDRAACSAPFALSLTDAGFLRPSDETAAPASDDALDEIIVMLLAGHETTASVLSWLVWELARRPSLQEAAAALLLEASPDAAIPASMPPLPDGWSGIDANTLLRGLCQEALRLYPPIAFFLREAEREVCCRGKIISPGSYFVISPWTLHRHRKKWDRPDEFLPERWWLQPFEPARTSYMPFGMGPRTCPGARFAEIEMREILRVLLTHCRFSVVSSSDPKPLGTLTSRPDREIHLAIESRNGD